MTGPEAATIRRRLLVMKDLVGHLASLGEPTAAALDRDLGLRLQVSMAIAQLVTLATEINAHVVTQESGTAPADLRDSFSRMAEVGWLDPESASMLQASPGLRNVIVHEYVKIDLTVLAAAVPMSIDQFGGYIRQVAARLPQD